MYSVLLNPLSLKRLWIIAIKYHFVWKTKYSYGILRKNVALRTRQILREICAENAFQVVSGNVQVVSGNVRAHTYWCQREHI